MSLMLHDAKKMASGILGPLPMADAPKPEADEPEDKMAGIKAAADDIMAAIEAKDSESLAMALKDFFTMCDEDKSEAPDAESEEA